MIKPHHATQPSDYNSVTISAISATNMAFFTPQYGLFCDTKQVILEGKNGVGGRKRRIKSANRCSFFIILLPLQSRLL